MMHCKIHADSGIVKILIQQATSDFLANPAEIALKYLCVWQSCHIW